jgi:delta-1-pyrroline-5-carboxylate synthetase
MSTSARDSAMAAREASRRLQALPTAERVAMLRRIADALVANEANIMEENAKVLLRLYRAVMSK